MKAAVSANLNLLEVRRSDRVDSTHHPAMKAFLRLLPLFAVFATVTPSAFATAIFVLTAANELMVVNAENPREILSIKPITGLEAGENLLGIDVRPSNAQLYALSDHSRLLTIDPNSGESAVVATLAADPTDVTNPFTSLNGTAFAIDFNPLVDRIRVVSDTEQNLRINPNNGLVTTDTALAYAAGDMNEGQNPTVASIAYSNNFPGTTTTTLYGIDDATFQVVVQNPPNNGTLNSTAQFGAVNATHVGFDIAPDGHAFVGGRHDVPGFPVEYILATLDPATGLGDSLGVIGDGTLPVRDIAVGTSISFSARHYATNESVTPAIITVNREGFLNAATAIQYSTFTDSASAGSDYTTAAGTLVFAANETTKTFSVAIRHDDLPEDDELIGLLLTNPTGGAVAGPPALATLRINANDRPDTTGPLVEFIGLTGPSRGIDGAVVHFNEDMDPATVQNVDNYEFIAAGKRGRPEKQPITSAVYDPVERRVTLAVAAFEQTEFKKTALRIHGKPAKGSRGKGVSDVAGNLLDGDRNGRAGGDAVQLFKVFSNTTLTFKDRDGDRVTLELTGGGHLDGVLPRGGPTTQSTQFWIVDPISLVTTLSGSVQKSRVGDGIVVIAEIIGLDKKELLPITTNQALRINRLTFSNDATGLGLR
jgi:hypothetical protein